MIRFDWRTIGLVGGFGLAALILYACSPAPSSHDTSVSSSMASASSSTSSSPIKPPPPRLPARGSGLWETTVSEQGSADAPRVFKLCLDKPTEALLSPMGDEMSADKCFKNAVTQNPDSSWTLISECNLGTGGLKAYSGRIEGDHSDNFRMSLRVQTMGAKLAQMNRVANYTVVSRRLGACEKDQKPGDMIESGIRINLYEMSGRSH